MKPTLVRCTLNMLFWFYKLHIHKIGADLDFEIIDLTPPNLHTMVHLTLRSCGLG